MRITLGSLLLLIAVPVGCLDMPITHLAKTGDPVGPSDASSDSGEDPQAACRGCLSQPEEPGPGCQVSYTECIDSPKCSLIIACGFENGCFQGSRRGFVTCGLPCVNKYAPTTDDPVLEIASKLFVCLSTGACGDMCFSSE
jgi:hypothetical protein